VAVEEIASTGDAEPVIDREGSREDRQMRAMEALAVTCRRLIRTEPKVGRLRQQL
jgi:hypothetical protein